jgi:hypothetical protein
MIHLLTVLRAGTVGHRFGAAAGALHFVQLFAPSLAFPERLTAQFGF